MTPDAGEEPVTWRRLHPVTPLARGWAVVAVLVGALSQGGVPDVSAGVLVAAIGLAGVLALAYGWLSWRATRFAITGDDLRLESGVVFHRSRRVRLARVQAVDVVRPLVARLLGLAELRLEVAGGGETEAKLAYLTEREAHVLRAELLALAAGIGRESPEAPERVLVHVPPGALAVSQLLTVPALGGLALVGGLAVAATVTGNLAFLSPLPALLGVGVSAVGSFVRLFDFTVADSPDGLRLRRGLTETRAQTVPPGRVQAVRMVEPLLWRRRGWVRLEVNVAGYRGEADVRSSAVLLPVAPRAVARAVLAKVLPGVDLDAVPLVGVPPRARRLHPLQAARLRAGLDGEVFVAEGGRFVRHRSAVLLARVQSVRVTQGPFGRALRLATVHVDPASGPVDATARGRAARDAYALAEEVVARSRAARARALDDQWMRRSEP